MSRQQYDSSTPGSHSPHSTPEPTSAGESDPADVHAHGPTPVSERPRSSPQSPQGISSSSEGYPSWLPSRPPPPAPRSTLQSSVAGMFSEAGPSTEPVVVGRKATPRSVRIVSLQSVAQGEQGPRREPTDQSRAFSGAGHTRVWSRATSAGLTPTLFSAGGTEGQLPRPRFRSPALHVELLKNPSWKMRLLYYLYPVFVFAHIPLQTFFDFNAVFMLILVAKNPTPLASGVPGTGRNWALAAAAYIASWVAWLFLVFIVYEVIYSFYRRWRVRRPLILPIYFSAPAFTFAAMSSYANFCFLYYIRLSAFIGDHGAVRDGLAETFYHYSQNLPTVALLLPRAGLSMALLFAFSSPEPSTVALGDAGITRRDGTFFHPSDGTLTSYARGVLIANAAWTAWRILILLISWIGLWIISGQGCAGLCGPRYRWEEEEAEKTVSAYNDNVSELDTLPWSWKECTLLRIKDAHDFCMTTKHPRTGSALGKEGKGHESREPSMPFEGIERVFAAVGLPSGPPLARRGILSDDLFASPAHTPDPEEKPGVQEKAAPELSSIVPPIAVVPQRENLGADPSGPLMQLPYPFTGYGAQISSEDVVPFPPSPAIGEREVAIEVDQDHEEEEEGEEEEEEEEEETSEVQSSGRRTSGSMSSLGRPVASRYPFQFRRPRGSASSHMSPHSHSTPYSTQSRSTQSRSTRHSRSTQSTGNVESSDSPFSLSSGRSPPHSLDSTNAIPMPPRHPQVARRARAGTVPGIPSSPGSPSPVAFPGGRGHARTRTHSVVTDTSMTFGPIPMPVFDSDGASYEPDESLMDVPEAEGSIEEAERQDSVGLLSAAPSPRTSLVNLRRRASSLSQQLGRGGRSHSNTSSSGNSRSRHNSSTSISDSARSRAQSLIQSITAASRSSIELVRSRTNSGQSASDTVLSSPENHTFGHPLREQWRAEEAVHEMSDIAEVPTVAVAVERASPAPESDHGEGPSAQPLRTAPSEYSVATERGGVPIAGRLLQADESMPDISTAAQSMVTDPTVRGSNTSSSDRTRTTFGAMDHYPGQGSHWQPM